MELQANGWLDNGLLARAATVWLDKTSLAPPQREVQGSRRGITHLHWRVFWDLGEHWRDALSIEGAPPTVTVVTTLSRQIFVPAQRKLFKTSTPEEASRHVKANYQIIEAPTVASRMDVMPLFGTRLSGDLWDVVAEEHASHGLVRRRLHLGATAAQLESDRCAGYWLGVLEYETISDASLPCFTEVRALVDGSTAALWQVATLERQRAVPSQALILDVPSDVIVVPFTA